MKSPYVSICLLKFSAQKMFSRVYLCLNTDVSVEYSAICHKIIADLHLKRIRYVAVAEMKSHLLHSVTSCHQLPPVATPTCMMHSCLFPYQDRYLRMHPNVPKSGIVNQWPWNSRPWPICYKRITKRFQKHCKVPFSMHINKQ